MATVIITITNGQPDQDSVPVDVGETLRFTSTDYDYEITGLQKLFGSATPTLRVPAHGSAEGIVVAQDFPYQIHRVGGPRIPALGNPKIIVQ